MTACRASCVLLLLPSCPTPLLAQTSAHPLARTLHGKVVKLKEGLEEPVANANVTLEGTKLTPEEWRPLPDPELPPRRSRRKP